MTEDAEMEAFVMAIPGSFNAVWGTEAWKKIGSWNEQMEAPGAADTNDRLEDISGNTEARTSNIK